MKHWVRTRRQVFVLLLNGDRFTVIHGMCASAML